MTDEFRLLDSFVNVKLALCSDDLLDKGSAVGIRHLVGDVRVPGVLLW